jgi:hypothetical protein
MAWPRLNGLHRHNRSLRCHTCFCTLVVCAAVGMTALARRSPRPPAFVAVKDPSTACLAEVSALYSQANGISSIADLLNAAAAPLASAGAFQETATGLNHVGAHSQEQFLPCCGAVTTSVPSTRHMRLRSSHFCVRICIALGAARPAAHACKSYVCPCCTCMYAWLRCEHAHYLAQWLSHQPTRPRITCRAPHIRLRGSEGAAAAPVSRRTAPVRQPAGELLVPRCGAAVQPVPGAASRWHAGAQPSMAAHGWAHVWEVQCHGAVVER